MCLKKKEKPSDILGLSEPLCKLIETVSCGIGKVYEPIHVRRMAKARAEEINLIAATINNNLRLPIEYKDGKIAINSSDANDLVQRAENRFLFEQIKKQQNIESVVDVSYEELENEKEVSNKPVDSDWINSFFDFVANVSDDVMQCLWGKLLAGEVKEPGSFSIRTLDVLRKMSKKEAIAFKSISPYVLHCIGDETKTFDDYFFLTGNCIQEYNISFSKIFDLSCCGLLTNNTFIEVGFDLKENETERIYGMNKSIKVTNVSANKIRIGHTAYLLTEAGRQLLPIILKTADTPIDKYFFDTIEQFKKGHALLRDPIDPKDVQFEIEEI